MPKYDDKSFKRGITARIALRLLKKKNHTKILVNDTEKEHRNFYKFFKRRGEDIRITKDGPFLWLSRK